MPKKKTKRKSRQATIDALPARSEEPMIEDDREAVQEALERLSSSLIAYVFIFFLGLLLLTYLLPMSALSSVLFSLISLFFLGRILWKRRKMKRDQLGAHKDVLVGTLQKKRFGRRCFLELDDERFEVQPVDFERAPEDVRVRLHVTPRARVVTRIQIL